MDSSDRRHNTTQRSLYSKSDLRRSLIFDDPAVDTRNNVQYNYYNYYIHITYMHNNYMHCNVGRSSGKLQVIVVQQAGDKSPQKVIKHHSYYLTLFAANA